MKQLNGDKDWTQEFQKIENSKHRELKEDIVELRNKNTKASSQRDIKTLLKTRFSLFNAPPNLFRPRFKKDSDSNYGGSEKGIATPRSH